MNEEQNKRTAAMGIISGNKTNVSNLLGGQVDTRAEMTRQGQYRNTAQQQDDGFYGSGELNINAQVREFMKQLGLVPAAKDQTVPEMPTVQIKPPAVLNWVAEAQSLPQT